MDYDYEYTGCRKEYKVKEDGIHVLTIKETSGYEYYNEYIEDEEILITKDAFIEAYNKWIK